MKNVATKVTEKSLRLALVWHYYSLIDLHMPALRLFPLFYQFGPNKTLAFCNGAQRLLETTFHTFQAAHVHVGLIQLHQVPNLLSIFGDFRLDAHLLSCRRCSRRRRARTSSTERPRKAKPSP